MTAMFRLTAAFTVRSTFQLSLNLFDAGPGDHQAHRPHTRREHLVERHVHVRIRHEVGVGIVETDGGGKRGDSGRRRDLDDARL
jgi:hypothetical protein